MPEVFVRKRTGRRSGGPGYKLARFYHHNRARIAVIVAFIVAGLLGLSGVIFAADYAGRDHEYIETNVLPPQ
jgi:hypothetical protein